MPRIIRQRLGFLCLRRLLPPVIRRCADHHLYPGVWIREILRLRYSTGSRRCSELLARSRDSSHDRLPSNTDGPSMEISSIGILGGRSDSRAQSKSAGMFSTNRICRDVLRSKGETRVPQRDRDARGLVLNLSPVRSSFSKPLRRKF